MPRSEYSESYPALSDLLGGWFDQDYDLTGETLEEILSDYVSVKAPQQRAVTRAEIDQFIRTFGETNASLKEAVERVFVPDVMIEGWEGLTTRQWLERVREMIR